MALPNNEASSIGEETSSTGVETWSTGEEPSSMVEEEDKFIRECFFTSRGFPQWHNKVIAVEAYRNLRNLIPENILR